MKGKIELRLQNIFRTLDDPDLYERRFDAIWVHEAISHMDAAEELVAKAARSMKGGG